MLSQNSSVGIVGMIWAGWFKNLGFQHGGGGELFLFSTVPQTDSETCFATYLLGT